MNDYPFGYLGLKTEACQRKKKSLFVMGTLKNNSTPAGDFTGYYVSWVAPLWELTCSPQLGYTGHSVLLILGCVCVCVCVCVKSLQSCSTLCDRMDCSSPGSSVHGILQARILEWASMPSSRGSSRPRDRTHVSYISCIDRCVLYC